MAIGASAYSIAEAMRLVIGSGAVSLRAKDQPLASIAGARFGAVWNYVSTSLAVW